MKRLVIAPCILLLAACKPDAPKAPEAPAAAIAPAPAITAPAPTSSQRLAEILAARPDEIKARYVHRHPQETLEFFGVEPGMTVLEALPGGGWYSKVFLAYLGADGHLIGADYAADMWPRFGFLSEEQLAAKETWAADWTAEAETWRTENSATVSAFALGSMPAEMAGTADAVVFIRALHNLNRFESEGQYLTQALDDAFAVLKPGGIFGVVQHEAASDKADDWANGSHGYLKRAHVIAVIEAAGFEYIDATEINANAMDQPGEEDVVWRLPPSLATSRDNPELQAQMRDIGESNRMTLKFRKPAA